MAILALTSLLESIELYTTNICKISFRFEQSLEDKVRLSLHVLKYLGTKFNNNEQFKQVKHEIGIAASESEYYLEEWHSGCLSSNIMLSKALDIIESKSTHLLESLMPELFKLSCVVSSFRTVSYEIEPRSLQSENIEVVDYLLDKFELSSDLEAISIVGGNMIEDPMFIVGEITIDRTLIARRIYGDSRIKHRFPIRAWVSEFWTDRKQSFVQGLLQSVMGSYLDGDVSHQLVRDLTSYEQQCEFLSKLLHDNKYLIVIHSAQIIMKWRDIKFKFPDNKNGSRILFTGYIDKETTGVVPTTNLFLINYEMDELRKLFNHLVFGGRGCPQELENIAQAILNCCPHSRAAIIMLAKHLSKVNHTMDHWLKVQESLELNIPLFKCPIDGIISALLKASEGSDCIHHIKDPSAENNSYECENKQTVNFKDIEGSMEVAYAKEFESVGLEKYLEPLVSELIRSSPQLEKMAVVGMAGIGKTTLAKKIFNYPSLSYHFDLHAWICISTSYSRRDLLIQLLLQCNAQVTYEDILGDSDYALEEKLYKSLKLRRFFIVMDDMWSIEAWNELKRIIPDDKMGSRILFTTRETNAIKDMKCNIVHSMTLLNENECWDLLHKKIFEHQICPPHLADIGKQIAKRCNGLPLAIVVVAGVLLKISKTIESWKTIEKSVCTLVMDNQNPIQAIFSMSYEHLPVHLKPCFLYMGAFPGGFAIEVRVLIRLWIVEGFIVRQPLKSLEDVGLEYLNDLIDRSLLLAGKRSSNGRVKTCHLHDLVLEFCVQEAHREKFLDVVKDFGVMRSLERRIDGNRRFSFHCHSYDDIHLAASKSLAGSALFFGVSSDILLFYFDFKLLRVLDLMSWRFDNFPIEQIAKLLLLRYLALTASFELPSLLFQLQKLQTLVINGPWLKNRKIPELDFGFWKCINIRNLQFRVATKLVPCWTLQGSKPLKFLSTLSNVTLGSFTNISFALIPNITKLGVCETCEDFPVVGLWDIFFKNLALLDYIQTLKVSRFGLNSPLPLLSPNAFPKSLKKLTLKQSYLPWEAMSLIDELPNLEVLKLRNYAFQGPEWETVEGGFKNLRYLLIDETNLKYWKLESDHFPHLEQIVLRFCKELEEIPNEIGHIANLLRIELHYCSASSERSAIEMVDEQHQEYCHDIAIHLRTHQTPVKTCMNG